MRSSCRRCATPTSCGTRCTARVCRGRRAAQGMPEPAWQVVCFGEALVDFLAQPGATPMRRAPSSNTPAARRPTSRSRSRGWGRARASRHARAPTCSATSLSKVAMPAWTTAHRPHGRGARPRSPSFTGCGRRTQLQLLSTACRGSVVPRRAFRRGVVPQRPCSTCAPTASPKPISRGDVAGMRGHARRARWSAWTSICARRCGRMRNRGRAYGMRCMEADVVKLARNELDYLAQTMAARRKLRSAQSGRPCAAAGRHRWRRAVRWHTRDARGEVAGVARARRWTPPRLGMRSSAACCSVSRTWRRCRAISGLPR